MGYVNNAKRRFLRRRSASFTRVLACALLAMVMLLPHPAHAQFVGKASATAQYESNSNVFYLDRGGSPLAIGGARPSDTYLAYGAQFDGTYGWRRQSLFASASTTQYNYQHFNQLDNNSYRLDAGLNWKIGAPLDGKLDVLRTHSMVPFFNLSGASLVQLSLVTEQRETAQAGLKLNARWRLEGSAYTSQTDQPIVGAPDLQLKQTGSTLSLNYLGVTGLTSGITAGYLTGDYQNSRDDRNSTFNQTAMVLTAKYFRARTTIDGQIGYSRRTSQNNRDETSGLTGSLEIAEQLTPKTRFSAKAARTINNYIFNSGSEIDSEAGGTLSWQTTPKSAFVLGYTFSYREFPQQGNNPIGSDRTDIQEFVTLDIHYQPVRWLTLRPYINAQTRRSTFVGGHYSSTIYGLSVIATLGGPKKRK